MKFRPDEPMHERYAVDARLPVAEQPGDEAITISQTVNAFFRWEFNSCEMLVKGGVVYPIDYANACPDVAVTSLHYYFPWAMKALVKWTAYCVVTGRKPRTARRHRRRGSRSPTTRCSTTGASSRHYQRLADDYFETERYRDFCETALPHVDEMVLEWIDGPDFASLLHSTIQQTYPPHEWERFEAHFGGLLGMWVSDERRILGADVASG